MIADDPLVLMLEAIDRAQVTAGLAEKQAAEAAKAAAEAAGKARAGAGRIAALETATTALAGKVTGWRQQMLDAATARRRGRWWVVPGVAAGLVLYPLLATTLPYGGYLGALAVNGTVNRWQAGAALMKAARSGVWDLVVADWNLITDTPANAKAVAECQKLAGQFGTAQSCGITVPVP